jgi:transcriptional/translational regulatory protein YebC/TACO1
MLRRVEESIIEEVNGKVPEVQIIYSPLELAPDLSEETQDNLDRLIDELLANEDVYHVWHN